MRLPARERLPSLAELEQRVQLHYKVLDQIGALGADCSLGFLRAAWSPEESEAIRYFEKQCTLLGLCCRYDAVGNFFATTNWPAEQKLQIGSHLDTVKKGGNFDGVVGVIAGLEALRSLLPFGPLEKNLELVIWRGEESGTFDVAFKGSKAAFGELPPSALLKTFQGISLREAIASAGFDPGVIERGETTLSQNERDSIAAHLEFHIEQGRVLEKTATVLGVATSIRGPHRTKFLLKNQDGFPLNHRVIAEIVVELNQFVRRRNDLGEDLVGTFGLINTGGSQNSSLLRHCGLSSVPGYAELRLTPAHISSSALRERIEPIERELGVSTELEFEGEAVVICVYGQFDHSGATPMEPGYRKDANLAASKIIRSASDLFDSVQFNCPVEPGQAELLLDLRSCSSEILHRAADYLNHQIAHICQSYGVEVEREKLPAAKPVESLNSALQNILCRSAEELGYSSMRLPSGAGHDVGVVSQVTRSDGSLIPTALGLIACKNGLSHCENEYSSPEQIAQACQIAALSLLKLSQR